VATVIPFRNDSAFEPKQITAMAMALEDVCKELNINGDLRAREIIASRIIELARRGEKSPTKLRDHLIAEANGQTCVDLGAASGPAPKGF